MRLTAILTLCLATLVCLPPASGARVREQESHAAKGTTHFRNHEAALAHIDRAMAACPEQITLRVSGAAGKTFLEEATARVNAHPGAWCYRYAVLGDELTLSIRYEDYGLMLGVHEGRLAPSRLTPAQKRAYRKACAIVQEAQAGHADAESLALALHDWIVLNSRYKRSVSKDGSASSILLHGEGLCECYTHCFYLLGRMAGLEIRCVGGKARGEAHAWNLLRLGNTWVHVDCTYDDPTPDTPGKAQHLYFGMGDKTISHDHRWERSEHPACPTDAHWYALTHTPRFATVEQMVAALVRRARAAGGKASLEGYVEEISRHPQRAQKLFREAAQHHHCSLRVEYGSNEQAGSPTAGFITAHTP